MNLCIGQNLSIDQPLWHYMSIAKYLSFLAQSSLWLARADTLSDRQEGRFPDEMRKTIEKAYLGFSDDDPSPVKDADDFQDYLVKNTFVNCWHKNFDENMAMWEIYGKRDNGVAIQTTVNNLKKCMDSSKLSGHSLILDNVRYQLADEVQGVLRYEECFFLKRPHFAFEEEVRLNLDTYSRLHPTKKTDVVTRFLCN